MIDVQSIIHYSLHLIFPFLIAYLLFRKNWKIAGLIMLLTFLIDLDHLFANPVLDPQRCSIGFHPLHSFPAIGIYIALLLFKIFRIPAVGLLLHMFADLVDCFWIFSKCSDCYLNSKIHHLLSIFGAG